jgi:GT2 family glycosyltransferase
MVPIIMLTYNRVEYTMEVLAAFKNHLLYPHKVIVIDNASTDGTREYLDVAKKLGFIDHLILNDTNLGIAEPKNQGLKAKTEPIKYIVITDNDIVPPFVRHKDGCILTQMVDIMEKHQNIGMLGIDLNRDNSPPNQEYWWRLRQHNTDVRFAEIVIGFWFTLFRYDVLKEFNFVGASNYGMVDESIRNYLTIVKKAKIGLIKGVEAFENGKHKETLSKPGIHLGWTEDTQGKYKSYVDMKKAERYKAEQEWKKDGRKW